MYGRKSCENLNVYKKSQREFIKILTPMCRQSHLREKMQNKTIRFKDDRIEFNLNTIYYES